VIDGECIDCISRNLCPDPHRETAHIIECSAGPGYLTKKLLESGVRQLHVFEHEDMDYLSMLRKVCKQYEDRVSLHLTSHYIIDYVRDMRAGIANIVTESLDNATYKRNWPLTPVIKSFVPLPPFTDKEMIAAILNDLCRRDGLFAAGRTQFLLLVSFYPLCEMKANALSYSAYYGYKSVMAQSMFDVEVIQTVPLCGMIPLIRRTRINTPEDPLMDTRSLYLIKMTPKVNLINDIPMELWSDYRFLVKQAMARKSGHVIPFFEKYFPNNGTRLIRIGVPLYSRFSELNAPDFMRIFNEITSWPEYSSSTFKMASASFSEECDEDEEDEDEEAGKVMDGTDGSGGEKLVTDVFA
jgi:phospholipid N-methyltransferase